MATSIEKVLANAEVYSKKFDKWDLPLRPRLKLAVLVCMDSRIDIFGIFGLKEGDAHVIRNAGGAADDDAVRSIMISQHLMGTEEIIVVHHTNCGMEKFEPVTFMREIEQSTGHRPNWDERNLGDLGANVVRTVELLRNNPLIPHRHAIRGFLYDVYTGTLTEPESA